VRRATLTFVLAVVVLAAPLDVHAGANTPPRVGVIGEASADDPFLEAFRQGLRDLGYVDGRNIAVQYRYLEGNLRRVPDVTAELVRLGVDVLVVGGTASTRAAKRATTKVPIVFTVVSDPVASGIVASLGHPGGNVTGTASLSVSAEISSKQLELLNSAVPRVSRIALLHNPGNEASGQALPGTREAARVLGVEVLVLEVRDRADLARAFAALTAARAGAVLALSDPVFGNEIPQLAQLAARHRLPAMYARREFVEAGGLLAYGPSFTDGYRRAASYVDRILKGAHPASLPVEQPTRFELFVNLKTARALRLTMPPSLLSRADEVLE
jgi:putative tryptophan/tyrosine transport system substrate-binding protein